MDLPLKTRTSEAWARAALREPLALLADHAHLEKKAAANALELLSRWPGKTPPDHWARTLAAVARDESEHLALVIRILHSRGGQLPRSHQNGYAHALRQLVRLGRGPEELVDRLLVSALIEARSCDRFVALAQAAGQDDELRRLYRGLWSSEHGHYRVFVELAHDVQPAAAVAERWRWMLEREAVILSAQPPGPRMHSGE